MANEYPGTCPHCRKTVSPRRPGENILKKRQYTCSSCRRVVCVCDTPDRTPSVKSSESYDAGFCPACADLLSKSVASVAQSILATIAAGAGAKVSRKLSPAKE